MSYKNSSNTEAKKNLDSIAEKYDYGEANRRFDLAMDNYFYNRDIGEDYAMDMLHSELKDYSYEFVIENFKNEYEEYTTGALKVYGNTYAYNTFGEKDYSDDQYFEKVK